MAATVVLPVPRPPVSPTRSMGELYREAAAEFCGADGVGHQHGDGERADASGYWSVGAGESEGFGVDISDDCGAFALEQLFTGRVSGEVAIELVLLGDAVDAGVEDDSSGLHHLGCYQAGFADSNDKNVCLASVACEVAGSRVANCHRGVLCQQQDRGGLAHNVAAADDDGILPGYLQVAAFEDLDDTRGCTGRKRRLAGLQTAHV